MSEPSSPHNACEVCGAYFPQYLTACPTCRWVPDGVSDDANVMRLWRECGLPEYFLGNCGSNHGLVALEKRIRAEERERCARIARSHPWRPVAEEIAADIAMSEERTSARDADLSE